MDAKSHFLTSDVAAPLVASARFTERPVYLVIKPPPAAARMIDRQRRLLEIATGYGPERFHITLALIGDARFLARRELELVCRAAASLTAEPFELCFSKLENNALVGGTAMGSLRSFQRRLVHRLAAFGVQLPDYIFRPHLSLVYGQPADRNISIPPIGWTVEEFLLIKSIHGEGRHEVLGRWPLVRRQGDFGF